MSRNIAQGTLPLEPERTVIIETAGRDLDLHCQSLRQKGYAITRWDVIGGGYRLHATRRELLRPMTEGGHA